MKKKFDEKVAQVEEYYEALISALRHVAYRCGYALAVHGSLKRDIDLIAAPWRDTAVSADYLYKQLKETCRVIIGFAESYSEDKPTEKDCGRLGWAINLTPNRESVYIDISIMPKVIKSEKLVEMHENDIN